MAAGLLDQPQPATDEQLRLWYRAFMLTYECLLEHGYPVNPPPSEEEYVESKGTSWHPYDAIPYAGLVAAPGVEPDPETAAEIEAARTLEQTCPQDLSVLIPELRDDG